MSFDDKTVSPSASHAERAVPHKMSPAEIADAQRAALAEHRLGFAEAFRKYKKAIIWSVIVSMVRSGAIPVLLTLPSAMLTAVDHRHGVV
jgi:hypothetical protein